jgi:hypothetical protein
MEKIIYIVATLFFIGLAVLCFGVFQKSQPAGYDLTAIHQKM